MKILKGINRTQSYIRFQKAKGKRIGFVPTMGALHEGHTSLIKKARAENDFVVVSIFVNPLQFGPKEDFKRYPRNFKRDAALCKRAGVDLIFYPDYGQMYPKNYKSYIHVEDLSNVLCAKSRPGHFKGVATVIAKLLNIVQPDNLYLGQKDAQQAVIIKKMVDDLNMPLNVKIMPTIRERDGLAMSSRNIYLSPQERRDAVVLYKALCAARKMIKQGKRAAKDIIVEMRQLISSKRSAKIDYIVVVDKDNLESLKIIKEKALIALAVRIGKTRLIDNMIINSKHKIQSSK